MSYTNSQLVSYTRISPNQSGARIYPITRISIHCVVGQCSVETLGNVFAPASRQASSNYGVGCDGKIGMYVPESNRSWCTSSYDNDNRAITIEVASDTYHPYAVRDVAYNALLDLVTDICKRNGKKKVIWISDKDKALAYKPAADEMQLTVHRWFANKSCPGDYLFSRHAAIAAEVTKRLGGAAAAPAPAATELTTGAKLTLNGAKIYASSTTAADSGTKTGTFYVWSATPVKGRVRITILESFVGVSGKVTGWIDLADAVAGAGIKPAASAPATEPDEECDVKLPVLHKGSESGYVTSLQVLLNKYDNAGLDEDGSFGPATEKAVIAYQRTRSLEADGYVGSKTWTQLLK